MKQIIFEWISKQGATLTILGIITSALWTKYLDLEKKIENCQGQQIELLKTTVQENTNAWQEFSRTLREDRYNK